MEISLVEQIKNRPSAHVLVLPLFVGKKEAAVAFPTKEFSSYLKQPLELGDFKGKEGESIYLYLSKEKEERLILLGLGDEKELTAESLRRSYAQLVKLLKKLKVSSCNVLVPKTKTLKPEVLLKAIAEGLFLSLYSFNTLRQKTKKEYEIHLNAIHFIGVEKKHEPLIQKVRHIVDAVNLTRSLVMGNADEVTPIYLAQQAKELDSRFSNIKTTIFKRADIKKMKMGLLEAVGRSSVVEPHLIVIDYHGDPHSKHMTALVGKGITFDTGGLNLKPTGGIEEMRNDKAGAAAVIGTIQAAASLRLKVNLIGVIASTENSIGPQSYKPGDVYPSHGGLTVEISNTDAEGRLVLADALSYVQEKYKPERIIDLATLTGGAVVALGDEVTALFSNNDKLAQQLTEAGQTTYERTWRLPLFKEYRDLLKSKVADLKNSGGKKASPITGAIFLQHFIKDSMPWAHLDIAGSAFPSDLKPYHPAQATGVGVRLLIEFLEQFVAK